MTTPKSTGRLIGALLLVQMAGVMAAFIILMPGVRTDYLAQAAQMEGTIRTAVILLMVNSAIALGIAIAAYKVFSEHSVRMALAWISTPGM